LYWGLFIVGIVAVVIAFGIMTLAPQQQTIYMFAIGAAYVLIIGAFIVDFAKVRPIIKKHQGSITIGGKKSPKQIKHEQETAARLAQIEADRKAAREAKRRRSRKQEDGVEEEGAQ
jgi:hypothetical protein